MPIVARVLQLSLANRSASIARLLGDKLGDFVEVPKDSENHYANYLRIKVLVDVKKPLLRGLYFQGVDGVKQWLQVVYERLPVFCFLCGVLGHGETNCPTRYEENFVEPEGEFPFGSWMRANGESRGPLWSLAEGRSDSVVLVRGKAAGSMGRTRSDIFTLSTKQGYHSSNWENVDPNIGRQLASVKLHGGMADQKSGSSFSRESCSSGVRKKVRVPLHKRKDKVAALGEVTNSSKKALLQLRDEDIDLTVEAAVQPRRQ